MKPKQSLFIIRVREPREVRPYEESDCVGLELNDEIPVMNVEVLDWLREKNFQVERNELRPNDIRPPKNTAQLTAKIQKYLEKSPTQIVTTKSVQKMIAKLKPYKLHAPELVMIANIRPEAYAHLTALIADVHNRYEDQQLTEILEIVNTTLEPRSLEAAAAKQDVRENPESEIPTGDDAEVPYDNADVGDFAEDGVVAAGPVESEPMSEEISKEFTGVGGENTSEKHDSEEQEVGNENLVRSDDGQANMKDVVDEEPSADDHGLEPQPMADVQSVGTLEKSLPVKVHSDGGIDALTTDLSSFAQPHDSQKQHNRKPKPDNWLSTFNKQRKATLNNADKS